MKASDRFLAFNGESVLKKVHAVMARSTFGSQQCGKLSFFEPVLMELVKLAQLVKFDTSVKLIR